MALLSHPELQLYSNHVRDWLVESCGPVANRFTYAFSTWEDHEPPFHYNIDLVVDVSTEHRICTRQHYDPRSLMSGGRERAAGRIRDILQRMVAETSRMIMQDPELLRSISEAQSSYLDRLVVAGIGSDRQSVTSAPVWNLEFVGRAPSGQVGDNLTIFWPDRNHVSVRQSYPAGFGLWEPAPIEETYAAKYMDDYRKAYNKTTRRLGRDGKIARGKAAKLWADSLNADQLFSYRNNSRIFVRGSEGGKYFIYWGYQRNIVEVDKDNEFLAVCDWCVNIADADIPIEDHMLMQKLLIESDENRFRSAANRFAPRNI